MKKRTLDERGFGAVAFLAVIPLVVAIIALVSAVAMIFKSDARLKHECRTTLLQAQRAISEDLRALVALNPQAQKLRAARAVAEQTLKAAYSIGHPAAITAAIAQRTAVMTAQAALRMQQQKLLLRARLRSLATPAKAVLKVKRTLASEMSGNGASLSELSSARSRARRAYFDVIAKPANDLTPDYEPSPRFSEKQLMSLTVDIDLAPLLPEWLRRLLPTKTLVLRTRCAATIEKENETWTETLSAVR